MIFFELSSAEQAEKISRLIYSICAPEQNSVTEYMVPWYSHPERANAIIGVQPSDEHKVYQSANLPMVLKELGAEFLEYSSQEELSEIGQYINGAERIRLQSIIPKSLQAAAMDYETAKTNGYFPVEMP